MELAAYRYQIGVPSWFNIYDKAYEQYRNRFNIHSHLDLHEILTNFGSSWFRGGLNLAAQLAGKPERLTSRGQWSTSCMHRQIVGNQRVLSLRRARYLFCVFKKPRHHG